MTWTDPVDLYCERLDASFWAEPVNALTNAAFLLAALVMAVRLRGASLPLANILTGILTAIGIGSFLFHTFAENWAGLADTGPILLFILAYIYAASRDFLGVRPKTAALSVAAFFPFAAITVPIFALVPGVGGSAGYMPVPLVIAGFAWALRSRAPETARGLTIGLGLLLTSLSFRMLDLPLCGLWPLGTHFLWHIVNGIMLGWMIEVYRRHMLAGLARGR